MKEITVFASLVAVLLIGFASGFLLGSYEPTEANKPSIDEPINTSASLSLNILNHGDVGSDGKVWVYNDLGQEVYYCETFVKHSGSPNFVNISWDDVSDFNDATLTIVVRVVSRQVEPVTTTREVKWRVEMGKSTSLIVTM